MLFIAPWLAQVASAVDVPQLSDNGAHGFGLGVILGEPTGLTVAARPNDHNAVQGHLSWSVAHSRVRLSADYLQSVVVIDTAGEIDLPVYVGAGATLGVDGAQPWGESPWLGLRVPIGLAMVPDRTPIELFGEIVPELFVLPELLGGLEGAIGARLYF
jgi:hypothetical protein